MPYQQSYGWDFGWALKMKRNDITEMHKRPVVIDLHLLGGNHDIME